MQMRLLRLNEMHVYPFEYIIFTQSTCSICVIIQNVEIDLLIYISLTIISFKSKFNTKEEQVVHAISIDVTLHIM